MRASRSRFAGVVALLAMVFSLSLQSMALAATVDYTQSSAGNPISSGIFYGNNLYSVVGANYGVYNDEACTDPAHDVDGAVAEIMVFDVGPDPYGLTPRVKLAPGVYYVKEKPLGANNTAIGYRVDPNVYRVELTSSHTMESPAVVKSTDVPITTAGSLRKIDQSTGGLPQGALSADGLAGAVFRLDYFDNVTYNQSQADAGRRDAVDGVHHRVWLFRTKADGTVDMNDAGLVASYLDSDTNSTVTSSQLYKAGSTVVWPLGTYLMTELKAPDGYEFPALAQRQQMRTISQNGEGASADFSFTQANEPKKIDIQVEKRDAEPYADRESADYLKAGTDREGDTDGQLTQGDTQHDAHYLIYNITGDYVSPGTITYKDANGVSHTVPHNGLIETVNVFGCALAADGKTWETEKVRLPASGVYKIVEDPNYEAVGMHNDPDWSVIIQPNPKTDENNKLYRCVQLNTPKRYGIFIFKLDADTNTPIINILNDEDYELIDDQLKHGQGDASLAGAEFEIINESAHSVRNKKTGEWVAPGEVVATITTHFDEERNCTVAHTDIDELPYGRYRVRESKPPLGYLPIMEDIGGAGTLWETPLDKPESYVVVGWDRYEENSIYGGRTPGVSGMSLGV